MPFIVPIHILNDDRETYCGASRQVEPAMLPPLEIADDETVCADCEMEYRDQHDGHRVPHTSD